MAFVTLPDRCNWMDSNAIFRRSIPAQATVTAVSSALITVLLIPLSMRPIDRFALQLKPSNRGDGGCWWWQNCFALE